VRWIPPSLQNDGGKHRFCAIGYRFINRKDAIS